MYFGWMNKFWFLHCIFYSSLKAKHSMNRTLPSKEQNHFVLQQPILLPLLNTAVFTHELRIYFISSCLIKINDKNMSNSLEWFRKWNLQSNNPLTFVDLCLNIVLWFCTLFHNNLSVDIYSYNSHLNILPKYHLRESMCAWSPPPVLENLSTYTFNPCNIRAACISYITLKHQWHCSSIRINIPHICMGIQSRPRSNPWPHDTVLEYCPTELHPRPQHSQCRFLFL